MSSDSEEPIVALVGLCILGIVVLILAYAHEAAAECLRVAVEGGRHFWDAPSVKERILFGGLAAGVLYAVLYILHGIFHVFRKPWLGIVAVILGAVIAGRIPPDELLPQLCHFV